MTKDEIILAQQARITELETTPPDKREDLRCVISDLCHQVRERDEKIVAQQARIEQLLSVVEDLSGLIDESSGVYGLHLNGDPSPWEELLPGGRFERITNFYEALATQDNLSALRAHDAKLLAPYQWQPIETAPKDGTEIILWFPFKDIAINGLYGEVSEGDWETGYRKWMEWLVADELWFQEDPSQAPTHWMPLPSTEAIEKGCDK